MAAKQRKKPDGRARRGKYEQWLTEEGLLKIEGWSRNGLTQSDIAHNIGIGISTLKDWMQKYPAFLAAIAHGREVADIRVENALYKRAIGYSYLETTREEGPRGVLVRTGEKTVVPDVTAQMFWLKNRKPDVWREKPSEHEDGNRTVEVIFDVDEEEEHATGADPAAGS